jgi:hypothetical protein
MQDRIESVAIRMYRGIFGDCFLMTIRTEGKAKNVVIDCGVLQGIPQGSQLVGSLSSDVVERAGRAALESVEAGTERIKRVARDIITTTAGHIDLLVLTHEHFDHLSGFGYARDLFMAENVVIDRLWMAWTEDPDDEQAGRLRSRFSKGREALALAAAVQSGFGAARSDDSLDATAALAAFMGPVDVPGLAANGAGSMSTRAIIDALRSKVGVGRARYLAPGQVLADGDGIGLKTYVLGPPRDEVLLEKSSPSAALRREVYLTKQDEAAAVASAARVKLDELGLDARQIERDSMAIKPDPPPFARPHRRGETIEDPMDPRKPLQERYHKPDQAYRQIHDEWTSAAESLALKMDADTNNTSLVLAFELPDGQILLFPGDAQVGNWLSWRYQTYPANPRPGEDTVGIDDILRHVVFYKVGHHGSDNATLKALGLDKMTNNRLTAAIPVVEALAAVQGRGRTKPGKGWQMPFKDLYDALLTSTKGRIVRGDGDAKAECRAFSAHPADRISVSHENAGGGLWVELTFMVA